MSRKKLKLVDGMKPTWGNCTVCGARLCSTMWREHYVGHRIEAIRERRIMRGNIFPKRGKA